MRRGLDGADLAGKRVLLRLDLNLPMHDGVVTDATRITRSLSTLHALIGAGARTVVMSHFGRPKGEQRDDMSLAPVAADLSAALDGAKVAFAADCVGPAAEEAVAALGAGEVLLLENLRFHVGEEANEAGFADALAGLGDVYVNDAFSCAHRAHASTEGLAHRLPAFAGRAMEAELDALSRALEAPARPLMAVVGGAKVSSKLAVLGYLVDKVDALLIGGGMANTFLQAQGLDIGASLSEPDMADQALAILARAEAAGCCILLPRDVVIADRLADGVDVSTVVAERMPEGMMILDIGPRSAMDGEAALDAAATVVWNGPVGAFETAPFDEATTRLARHAAARTRAGELVSVAGGGDTVAALNHAGVLDDFSYVSTAGGAFLEWLEGRALPGVAALEG